MEHIAIKDDEGQYRIVFGRYVGKAATEAEALALVRRDIARGVATRLLDELRSNADQNADIADSSPQD